MFDIIWKLLCYTNFFKCVFLWIIDNGLFSKSEFEHFKVINHSPSVVKYGL